jgi:glycosyltransferase involved in cell wall biosynthesis
MHVHLIRTLWRHWGRYSGINQFVKYVDPRKCRIDEQIVSDGDDDFPVRHRVVRESLRRLVWKAGGMHWYKLSDLWAEITVFLRCWRKHIDVIHYLDADHSAQFLPRLLKRLGWRTPIVLATYHQPPEILDSIIPKRVLSELDCISVVSHDQVEYFEKLVEPRKIRLVLHGIDTDYFRPEPRACEDGTFKCITVGFWRRDFPAVRAVALRLSGHPRIEFHVVSPKAGELSDVANIKVYSGLDDAQLLELYQRSDVLFLPLLEATANNALLEGIACGLPVVSTSLPSVRGYVPGREAILIRGNDPKEMADAILHLARHPLERAERARAARRRAEELDWRRIAPQYEAIYSELVQTSPPGMKEEEGCHVSS